MKSILWAIDPFEEGIKLESKTILEFANWAKQTGRKIEPVYVMNAHESNNTEIAQIEAKISAFIAKYPIETVKPAILINKSRSVTQASRCVLEHAKKVNAFLIAVSSHGRSGLSRMRFGSFAEALLTEAQIPLFFINRKSSATTGSLKKTLWPSDFSKHCQRGFSSFLGEAKGFTTEIVLFHDVSFPLEMMSYGIYGAMGLPANDSIIEDQQKWAKEECSRLIKKAIEAGYESRGVVSVQAGQIAGSILREAHTNGVGLIAMASKSGPFSSVLLGSEAYEVFRSGEFPVWIYGPQFGEKDE
jgi:nucleotide-binding universal stress UspA family protein